MSLRNILELGSFLFIFLYPVSLIPLYKHMKKTKNKLIYSECLKGINNTNQIHNILLRERARSDRNLHEFSVIVLDISNLNMDNPFYAGFCSFIKNKLRLIDEIGWLTDHQIVIVLPYNSAKNAVLFAERIQNEIESFMDSIEINVFTYPSIWPFKKESENNTYSIFENK